MTSTEFLGMLKQIGQDLGSFSRHLAEARLHPRQEQLRELTDSLSIVEEQLIFPYAGTLRLRVQYKGSEYTFAIPGTEAEAWASALVPLSLAARDLLGYYGLVEKSLQDRVKLTEVDYEDGKSCNDKRISPPLFITVADESVCGIILDYRILPEGSILWKSPEEDIPSAIDRFRSYQGRVFYASNPNNLPIEEAMIPLIKKAYQKKIETDLSLH